MASLSIRVAWLAVVVSVGTLILPFIYYDETHLSSLCQNFGVINPFTGNCLGSLLTVQISFEHEATGVGFIVAALLMRNAKGTMVFFLLLGLGLFFSDSSILSNIGVLPNASPFPTDYVNNPGGSLASASLGFVFAFSFYQITTPAEDAWGHEEIEVDI